MLDQCLLFRDIFDNRHDHDLDFSPRKISRAFFQGVCGLMPMMMRLLSNLENNTTRKICLNFINVIYRHFVFVTTWFKYYDEEKWWEDFRHTSKIVLPQRGVTSRHSRQLVTPNDLLKGLKLEGRVETWQEEFEEEYLHLRSLIM